MWHEAIVQHTPIDDLQIPRIAHVHHAGEQVIIVELQVAQHLPGRDLPNFIRMREQILQPMEMIRFFTMCSRHRKKKCGERELPSL